MDYRKMHFPTKNYIFILKSIAERKAIKENLSKASVSLHKFLDSYGEKFKQH